MPDAGHHASASTGPCGADVTHGGHEAIRPRRDTFHWLCTCQDGWERAQAVVLFLRVDNTERKGEKEQAALRNSNVLQREDPEGVKREPGAPALGVWRHVLLAGVQWGPLSGLLREENRVFFSEALLQRSKGFLCFLLSSGGLLPLPAHLLFSLLPR